MPPSSTGSHQRVRLQRQAHQVILHATIVPGTFNPDTGVFSAMFDVDTAGTPASVFTPASADPGAYTDEAGRSWTLIN